MRGSSQFEGLLDGYFETFLADHPTTAAAAGIKAGEGKLERATLKFEERRERRRQAALNALDSLSPRDLTNEQHLDRLALRGFLLHASEDFSRNRHALEPDAIDRVLNVMLHELIRGEDLPKRAAENIRSLLRQTPRFLDEAATLIDKPEPVWRKIMRETFEGAGALFDAIRVFLQANAPQAGDAGDVSAAQRAVAKYHDHVMSRPPAAAGSFAIGAETLQRRVRDELGLDYTLGQIEALANAEAGRLNAELGGACAKFGKGKRAGDVIDEARRQWTPKGDLLSVYRDETRRIAASFRSARAVSFPKGDELQVRPVPEFMRHLFPTAAYSSPGAFEKKQRGIFWVNDLSATKNSATEKRAEIAQHFGLGLTCAHEAYPGHHLQFVTANRHPRKWRRLFAHAIFYEGWTLWCEQMMVDLRIERSPWLKVQQLHDALWRCHRILVDLRLQTGRYSYQQAVGHMQRHLGFTKARAQADVNWYTGSPAVPMSYWLGRLENERLRKRLVDGRGWSLQRFNDWLLSFGTLPQSWMEKYGLD